MPNKVWMQKFEESGGSVSMSGMAVSHEDVAEMMRSLANVVWTPKGMGRLVEQKRDASTAKVELLAGGGAIEEFATADIGTFFNNIDLKRVTQKGAKEGSLSVTRVDWELTLTANYAI
jgi:type IV pilus assembly protein PilN